MFSVYTDRQTGLGGRVLTGMDCMHTVEIRKSTWERLSNLFNLSKKEDWSSPFLFSPLLDCLSFTLQDGEWEEIYIL